MEKETIDLRNLMLMIKEKKALDCQLSLEFDCTIEVMELEPLVKIINYCINYINQLASQPLQISLYAGFSEHKLVFTAFTELAEFPPVSEKVSEALHSYNADITLDAEPGKFSQIQLTFHKEDRRNQS